MYYTRITQIERLTDEVATLYFSICLRSYPGQFVMVYVPGCEEIPLSLSSSNSVTVKAVGETTASLVNAKEGQYVGVRGAFGSAFTPSKRALIVAGGIGIAPMKYLYEYLMKCGSKVSVVYGERTAKNLFWLDKFDRITVTTEDGSFGLKGTVLDALKLEKLDEYEKIYVCGSEGMLRATYDFLKERDALDKAEFSLERYMRCGIGVCGSCVIENGLRVCADGPVFNASELPW
ncbi:dihydroorotate dehydrogenase electron transfer subunit [Archaeoglobus sp.]|uniref:dihydroorotate dehydrogenase electron transfer subunit n=1 Tax=Archaeoglobus sp. TaxID=1872626 RepID=UPI0024AB8189|nr:dihydroorotate dehydrogenase electron transfer subunit [Archaeoglobus sp.]MDI3496952.1 dihydroorotate dehydrogenase electron transfer subunit [Archaeoglobus sp.]